MNNVGVRSLVLQFALGNICDADNRFVLVATVAKKFNSWCKSIYPNSVNYSLREVKEALLMSKKYMIIDNCLIGCAIRSNSLSIATNAHTSISRAPIQPHSELPAKNTAVPIFKRYSRLPEGIIILHQDKNSVGNRIYKTFGGDKKRKVFSYGQMAEPINDDFQDLIIETSGRNIDDCIAESVKSIHDLRKKRVAK